jgi:N-acetylornithine carbamoyltransferase
LRDFLSLGGLTRQEVADLVALARRLQERPEPAALRGKILGLLFFNPSLRTLASFQAGMARLGGTSFVIAPGQGSWLLETRTGVVMDGAAAEHVREAIPVLAGYADALGIRAFAGGQDLAADVADETFHAMAAVCPVPLVNMESAIDHPCQALGDWKTLDDLGVPAAGGRFVLSWAWHPKALPLAVPAAVVHMAALRGMEVTVLRPEGYALPAAVMERARRAAAESGGSVRETDDRRAALAGAHVIYAKSWGSPERYGWGGGGGGPAAPGAPATPASPAIPAIPATPATPATTAVGAGGGAGKDPAAAARVAAEAAQAEAALRAPLRGWCVAESWFAAAAPGCRFMHCLPVRRGAVVRDEVLDGPRSVVVPQAHNRMWAQMAVLYRLLGPAASARPVEARAAGARAAGSAMAGGAAGGGTAGSASAPTAAAADAAAGVVAMSQGEVSTAVGGAAPPADGEVS